MNETPNPHVIDADTITGEMRPIRQAVISIGSNLGDRLANLQGAVDSLADTTEVWVTDVSPVYETTPVDAPAGSEDYLNAIVLLDTTLSVHTLLDRAMAIELAYGRERGERNAPRTLDVDLVVVGDRRCDDEYLTLPHPRAAQRAFVLVPWLAVDDAAQIPGTGSAADLLAQIGDAGVVLREDLELTVQ